MHTPSCFKASKEQLQLVLHSMLSGVSRGSLLSDLPPAWIGPARPQLDSEELARRTKLTLSVPRAELEAALLKVEGVTFGSSTHEKVRYSSGSLIRLVVAVSQAEAGRPREVMASLQTRRFQGLPVYSQVACNVAIYQLRSDSNNPRVPIMDGVRLLSPEAEWCGPIFTASSPSDLEPHLVDGCLRLEASVKVLH